MAEYKAKELRAYIYDVLQGNVTYTDSNRNLNGYDVPVANRAYFGLTFPHIIVNVGGFIENGTKDFFGGIYSVTLEIVDRFPLNEGGQDGIDDITNTALSLLEVRGNTRRFGNSALTALRYMNDTTIEEEDETFYYCFRRVTLEAEIHQDNQADIVAGDILQGDLQLDLNG